MLLAALQQFKYQATNRLLLAVFEEYEDSGTYNTYPRSMHIPDLCFELYHLTSAVAVFIDASFTVSVSHAMNYIITNKMAYSTEH